VDILPGSHQDGTRLITAHKLRLFMDEALCGCGVENGKWGKTDSCLRVSRAKLQRLACVWQFEAINPSFSRELPTTKQKPSQLDFGCQKLLCRATWKWFLALVGRLIQAISLPSPIKHPKRPQLGAPCRPQSFPSGCPCRRFPTPRAKQKPHQCSLSN
jgi:hypothetical protein